MTKPLSGKRIVVCGKGGCGKSSIVALMAQVLRDEAYWVIVLDGDASNPGGVARLIFGPTQGPAPLIRFFGGRKMVECPVDNPAPLTRMHDPVPIREKNIDLAEMPPEYFLEKENILLFQVGKIEEFCEGCDGPMSKVARDFIVKGEYVQVIDIEAGIEHFGRGVEQNIDFILVVVDPTFESLLIAEKVFLICSRMGKERVWTILNKVQSEDMESIMRERCEVPRCEVRGFECEAFGYTRSQKPEDRKSLQLRCRQNKPLTRPLATLSPRRGVVKNTLLPGEKVPRRGG
jgi:CO dehydrogenase maturation factor